MSRKLTEMEESIVKFARESGQLAELCVLVDYDPSIGRVPEHWVPRYEVLSLAQHLIRNKEDSTSSILYEWVDHDGDVLRTVEPPNPCETNLPVRRVVVGIEDGIDLRLESLVNGFRNHGYKVDGQPVQDRKQEFIEELQKGMRNVEYIMGHTPGSRTQKLKVLHERLPEPCCGVFL